MKIYSTRRLYAAGILPKPPMTEDVGQLAERLRALRLSFAADQLPELVTQSVRASWSSARFLDELIRLDPQTTPKSLKSQFDQKYDHNSAQNSY